MKLYHWILYIGKRRFDYLVMAADVEAARAALVANIQSPGGEETQQAGHDETIRSTAPSFVCEENYPLVIWPAET